MSGVIFYTQAYNAEKTLGRAVESILNQTRGDFLYYIFDDGSTDGTSEMIKDYERSDSRIIAQLCDINHKQTPERIQPFITFLSSFLDSDDRDGYWAMLDADDEYKPEFIERMMAFIEKNDLDIAACGSDNLIAQTGGLVNKKVVDSDLLLLRDSEFSGRFPEYHWFMRTIWGKLYSLSSLRKCSFENVRGLEYGSDTLFATEAFRNAGRIGILAGTLHRYYISPTSVSYIFDSSRIASDQKLDNAAREFLTEKCGVIDDANNDFLQGAYFVATMDTLEVILKSQIGAVDKISGLHSIFTSEQTSRLIAWKGFGDNKQQLRGIVSDWLFMQQDKLLEPGVTEQVIEILAALGSDIGRLMNRSPLLDGMPEGAVVFLRFAVAAVLRGDLRTALDEVFRLAEGDIPGEFAEDYLVFAQNVSAALEYADGWVFFKKQLAAWLVEQKRFDEARILVMELNEILTDDDDLRDIEKLL